MFTGLQSVDLNESLRTSSSHEFICIQFHVAMLVGIVIVSYRGETEEELMKNAAEHAVKDHGYKEEEIMTPEMKKKIKSYVRKT